MLYKWAKSCFYRKKNDFLHTMLSYASLSCNVHERHSGTKKQRINYLAVSCEVLIEQKELTGTDGYRLLLLTLKKA